MTDAGAHLPDAVVRTIAAIISQDECYGNRLLYLLQLCGVCRRWRNELACEAPPELVFDGFCGVPCSQSKPTLLEFRKQSTANKRLAFEGAAACLRGYSKAELSGESISDEVLYRIAQRNGHKLTHIKLKGTSAVTDAALAVLFSSAPNLQELDLEHVGHNIRGTCLPLLLAACPKLESLRIEGAPGINWAGLRPLWPPLWPSLHAPSRLHRSFGAAAPPLQQQLLAAVPAALAGPTPAPAGVGPAHMATAAAATAAAEPAAGGGASSSSSTGIGAVDTSMIGTSTITRSSRSGFDDHNHFQADSLSQDGAMDADEGSSPSIRTTGSSGSTSGSNVTGASSDAGEDVSDFLSAAEAEGFQLLGDQVRHSRSISAANVMAGLSGLSLNPSTSNNGTSSSGNGAMGSDAASAQQQLMAAAGSSSSSSSGVGPSGQGSSKEERAQGACDSSGGGHSSGSSSSREALALAVDLDTSLSACGDGPYVPVRASADPATSARTPAVAAAKEAAAAAELVELLPQQLRIGSLPVTSGRASSPMPGSGELSRLGSQALQLGQVGPSSVRQITAAEAAERSSTSAAGAGAGAGAVAETKVAVTGETLGGHVPAAAVHGRLRDPCPPHRNLRRLHVRFANLLPGRADNGVPGHAFGSGRCALEDLLLRVPCLTELAVDGPATVLDFAAKACPQLRRLGVLVSHPEQLEEVLWSLTMVTGLRELLLEVMNFVVNADHLKVLGMLHLTELAIDSHAHKQAPDMPPRAYSHVDNEGVKALVDSICTRMRMRGEVTPFKLSLCGATALKQEAVSALLRLPILTGVDTAGCSKLSPMDRMRLVAKVKAGQGLLEVKQPTSRALQYPGLFY